MKKDAETCITISMFVYAIILALIGIVLYLDEYNPEILNGFFYKIFG